MAKSDLGTKRICPTTGKKFYDLNKNPVISPYSGEVVPIAPIPPPRTRADAAARAAAAASAASAAEAPEPAEAEELVPLEEADAEEDTGKVKAAVPESEDDIEVDETIEDDDDDPLVRAYVNTQLQSLGYKTLSAANGVEALAIVDSGAAFDLLFTDIIMPGGLNGRQLAAEATARRPSLRVLFTSGYTENAIIHHGRLDSGVLLLAKPYRKLDLARMLRVALTSAGILSAAKPETQS